MLVMVDQEGGRVQRLKEPHWPRYPAARLRMCGAMTARRQERPRISARA
jgi:beta-N-acetylhexosaminidase